MSLLPLSRPGEGLGARLWRWAKNVALSSVCVVLLAAAFIGIKTVPIMASVYEFQDEVVRIADKANIPSWKEPKRMQEALLRKAEELRLPVAPEAIKVTRTEKNVEIKVAFDVEIDYGFYTYRWHKQLNEFRPLF